ncbi:MAG: radical SAM family heme chaperone HemW [Candidatus Gracilibacteria bacterium]|nr:radical SAM family heme chaperone HemW [Candidatus Gracilibacteria bacterium]
MKIYNCYIHIPFCNSKCKYCRFASFSGFSKLKIQNYVDFLCKEILDTKIDNVKLDTIYFGGGTPGVLSINQFIQIFNALKSKFIFSENIEISIETTPSNITIKNIIGWKNLGINRISIGLQTLNEKSLLEIGRDSKGDIIGALDTIKKIGFSNFSIDFIIGLPYVKGGEIIQNIDYLLKNYDFIKHISVYMLEEYYDIPEEKNSKFDNIIYPNTWKNLGLKDDFFSLEYISIKKFLEEKGFKRYEISNYSKPGFECKHNIGYWTHKETFAFGLGAHGFLGDIRFSNSESFIDYYAKKNIIKERLNMQDLFLEKIMFSLRTSGIEESDLEKLDIKKINYFIENNLLYKKDKKIVLSDAGVIFMDYILGEII